jgi:lysophospholipase L1-like esterase
MHAWAFVFLAVVTFALAGCGTSGCGPLIVCFGDSITEQGGKRGGYVGITAALFREACPHLDARLIAAGASGSRVPDLERRCEADVLARRPDAVVVMIGINDVWHTQRGGGTPRLEFEAGLRRLVQRLQAARIRVILCTPGVIGEKPAGMNPLDTILDDYADVTRQVAIEAAAELVDLRRKFKQYLEKHNPGAAPDGILTYDGVHLTATGNRLVAEALVKGLTDVISCEPPPTPRAP